jgi:hypothetical protein
MDSRVTKSRCTQRVGPRSQPRVTSGKFKGGASGLLAHSSFSGTRGVGLPCNGSPDIMKRDAAFGSLRLWSRQWSCGVEFHA